MVSFDLLLSQFSRSVQLLMNYLNHETHLFSHLFHSFPFL